MIHLVYKEQDKKATQVMYIQFFQLTGNSDFSAFRECCELESQAGISNLLGTPVVRIDFQPTAPVKPLRWISHQVEFLNFRRNF